MRVKHTLYALTATALIATAATGPAAAQQRIEFLSLPVGSVANAISSAIAAEVSKKTKLTILTVPYAGPQVFVPLLDSGEGALGMFNGVEAKQAFDGIKPFYQKPHKNLRLISVAYENRVGGLVPEKSGLFTYGKLKGARAAGVFSAHQTCLDIANALLANYNMKWTDFRVVPTPSAVGSMQAIGDGRVEFNPCGAVGLPVLKEVNTRMPVRFIPVDTSPEAMKRARDIFTGLRAVTLKAGSTEGVVVDTAVFTYDFMLAGNAKLSDDAVYTITKTIWDDLDDLRKVHPAFRLWTRERMAGSDVTVPYHPGAIKFFKEKGVWTPEHEQVNAENLKRAGLS